MYLYIHLKVWFQRLLTAVPKPLIVFWKTAVQCCIWKAWSQPGASAGETEGFCLSCQNKGKQLQHAAKNYRKG